MAISKKEQTIKGIASTNYLTESYTYFCMNIVVLIATSNHFEQYEAKNLENCNELILV